jgi:outer membrane lipoprotein-sorting protein
MKRLITLTAVLALMVSLGGSWPTKANGNPQLLTGILQKMEKAHMDLKSLKAVIMQQKVNVQINVKDTDQGTILYKPAAGNEKGKIRIDYTKPDTRIVSVVGNNFVFYQPRINQVVKTTLQQASKGKTGGYTSIIGLDGSLKNLARNYNIEYVKEESIGGEATTQLHLTPKNGGSLQSVEIWVSNRSWLPVQQKFVEKNGDYTIVKLTNLEPNLKLSDDAFIVKYPNSTVVVDKI